MDNLFEFSILIGKYFHGLCNHLDEEERERADCLGLIIFMMSCHRKWSVTLPRGVLGWSAVFDWGCSLINLIYVLHKQHLEHTPAVQWHLMCSSDVCDIGYCVEI